MAVSERLKVSDKGQHRTLPLVLALVAVVAGVAVYVGARSIGGDTCDWSDTDEQRLRTVPFSEFLGFSIEAHTATCDVSAPEVLFIEVRLPDGRELPLDWRGRTTVGDWNSVPAGLPDVRCYVTTREQWHDIQVYVRTGGVEASIERARQPCGSD